MLLHQPSSQGVYTPAMPGTANGDVVGPASATDGAIALFDGVGGKTLKNSDLVYSGLTLSVPDGFTVSPGGAAGMRFNANLGINVAPDANIANYLAGTVTGATGKYGYVDERIAGTGVTSALVGFSSSLGVAASISLTAIRHFSVGQGTFGGGSTVTTQVGFNVSSNMTGATSNYAFRGLLAAASGRWNIYMDGTAQNYLAGVTGIGIAASATAALALAASTTGVASLRIPSGTAPSSPLSGDLWYNGTNLIFRDGATSRTLSWT